MRVPRVLVEFIGLLAASGEAEEISKRDLCKLRKSCGV